MFRTTFVEKKIKKKRMLYSINVFSNIVPFMRYCRKIMHSQAGNT